MTLPLPPDSKRRSCATSAGRDLSAASYHHRRDNRGYPLASSLRGRRRRNARKLRLNSAWPLVRQRRTCRSQKINMSREMRPYRHGGFNPAGAAWPPAPHGTADAVVPAAARPRALVRSDAVHLTEARPGRYRGHMGGSTAGATDHAASLATWAYRVQLAGCAEARYLADPAHGPLSPDDFGSRMPGTIEDLGGGAIGFDDLALTTLAGLAYGVDGRVTYRQERAFLLFGSIAYPVAEH